MQYEPTFNTIQLNLQRITQDTLLSSTLRACSDVRLLENICGVMILRMECNLYGADLDAFTCRYPADWREAFKERWFPQWLLRRYPVRYIHKKFERKVVFPEWVHAHPHLGRPQVLFSSPNQVALFRYKEGE